MYGKDNSIQHLDTLLELTRHLDADVTCIIGCSFNNKVDKFNAIRSNRSMLLQLSSEVDQLAELAQPQDIVGLTEIRNNLRVITNKLMSTLH